jgi:hypothetical protein
MTSIRTVCGIDQGRDSHWIVILQWHERDPQAKNIMLADAIAVGDILPALDYFGVNFGLIDNEPERAQAYSLVQQSSDRLAMADQKVFDGDFKKITVRQGGEEMPCYGINSALYCDRVTLGFTNQEYRVAGKVHQKWRKHLTSVRRNPDSGRWERPPDKDDDLFFANLMAEAAIDIWRVLERERAPAPPSRRAIAKPAAVSARSIKGLFS